MLLTKQIITLITITIIILFIYPLTSAWEWEEQHIRYQNETLKITPLIEICENSTTVFRIDRLNYSQNSSPLTITYWHSTTNESQQVEINKTINKYTQSNTGNYIVGDTGNYTLQYTLANITLEWNFTNTCKIYYQNISQKNNSLNTTNTTINITNSTLNTSINISINTSINTSIPQTNNTNETNTSIISTKCFSTFYINTQQEIFKPKEKVSIYFVTDYWPEEYNITYHIEDLEEHIIKKEYVTTNNNPKSYTTKASEQKEQTYKIIAELNSICGTLKQEKIFVVTNEHTETNCEEITTTKETNTLITKKNTSINFTIKEQENNVFLTIIAQRGDSKKSKITIRIEDEQGRKIGEENTIYIPTQQQEIKTILDIQKPNIETYYISITGLDLEEKKKITQKISTIEHKNITTTTNTVSNLKKEENAATSTQNSRDLITANVIKNNSIEITAAKTQRTNTFKTILFISSIIICLGITAFLHIKKT